MDAAERSNRRRTVLARCLIYAAPCLAALAATAVIVPLGTYYRRTAGPPAGGIPLPITIGRFVLLVSAAVATLCPAAGAILLPDHWTWTRVGGAALYAVAGLFTFGVLFFLLGTLLETLLK